MFQTKFADKIKTHSFNVQEIKKKMVPFVGNVQKYCITRQAIDDYIIRCMRFACWVTKDLNTQYVLLFHGNHGCRNASQFYVHTYIAPLFGKCPIALAVAFCLPSAENHILYRLVLYFF